MTTRTSEPGAAGDGARRLEQRYRRLLTLLPQSYRTDRGEEMVGVFLDNADAGQVRPGWRETVGMAMLGVAPAVAVLAPVDAASGGTDQVSLSYFAHYGSQILLAETGLLVVAAAMGALGVVRGRRFGDDSVQRAS